MADGSSDSGWPGASVVFGERLGGSRGAAVLFSGEPRPGATPSSLAREANPGTNAPVSGCRQRQGSLRLATGLRMVHGFRAEPRSMAAASSRGGGRGDARYAERAVGQRRGACASWPAIPLRRRRLSIDRSRPPIRRLRRRQMGAPGRWAPAGCIAAPLPPAGGALSRDWKPKDQTARSPSGGFVASGFVQRPSIFRKTVNPRANRTTTMATNTKNWRSKRRLRRCR